MNTLAQADIIDQAAELTPGSPLHALRHQRDKVAAATQGSYDAMFDTGVEGISVTERLLVALHACCLSNALELSEHYRSRLVALNADPALLAVAESPNASVVSDPRLHAILNFTHTLITNPVAGDKPALMTLKATGMSTPAIVALAQLIAFLSYQLRVVLGLQAMQAVELEEAST